MKHMLAAALLLGASPFAHADICSALEPHLAVFESMSSTPADASNGIGMGESSCGYTSGTFECHWLPGENQAYTSADLAPLTAALSQCASLDADSDLAFDYSADAAFFHGAWTILVLGIENNAMVLAIFEEW